MIKSEILIATGMIWPVSSDTMKSALRYEVLVPWTLSVPQRPFYATWDWTERRKKALRTGARKKLYTAAILFCLVLSC